MLLIHFDDWCYQASHQICLHLIDIAATGHKAETLLARGKGVDVPRFSTMAIISKSARSIFKLPRSMGRSDRLLS